MGEALYIISCILTYGGIILCGIGAFFIFKPLVTGEICSWDAPCGLKEGYDCKTCTLVDRKKTHGILNAVVQLVSFGMIKKV